MTQTKENVQRVNEFNKIFVGLNDKGNGGFIQWEHFSEKGENERERTIS